MSSDLSVSRSEITELALDRFVRPLTSTPRAVTGATVEVRTANGQAQLAAPVTAVTDAEVPGGLVARLGAVGALNAPGVQLVVRVTLPDATVVTTTYAAKVRP